MRSKVLDDGFPASYPPKGQSGAMLRKSSSGGHATMGISTMPKPDPAAPRLQRLEPDAPSGHVPDDEPSGAGIGHADPTLIRTGGFARPWGYGGQPSAPCITGSRITASKLLTKVADPVGPDYDAAILSMAARAATVFLGLRVVSEAAAALLVR